MASSQRAVTGSGRPRCPGDYLGWIRPGRGRFQPRNVTQIDVFQMSVVAQVLGYPRGVWELNNTALFCALPTTQAKSGVYPQVRFQFGEFTPS